MTHCKQVDGPRIAAATPPARAKRRSVSLSKLGITPIGLAAWILAMAESGSNGLFLIYVGVIKYARGMGEMMASVTFSRCG